MSYLWKDLRYSVRMLMKQKGVTIIAILSLALGIGANTALFSVLDAMLLKLLPVREPNRLVLFQSYAPRGFSPGNYSGNTVTDPKTGLKRRTSFPYISYQRMRKQQKQQQGMLSDIFAFDRLNVNLIADGQAEIANGQVVTGNYYAVLGLQPLQGRLLTEDDDKLVANPVVVLSYRYWQTRFGGNPSVVGKQINLNNVAFTVIGVSPQGFEGAGQVGVTVDVTIPLSMEPQLNTDPKDSLLYGAGTWSLRIIGRLKPGVTREQVQAQLEIAFQQSVVEHRAARNKETLATGGKAISTLATQNYPHLALISGAQGEMSAREEHTPSLYLLFGIVGIVLLIACSNVANLLLSRASSRQKEISVRLALGASRWSLIRQLLTESVLLAVCGGALGLLFALWIKSGLIAVSDWGPVGLEPKLDWRVLSFTLGLSLLTGIIFGLAPALRTTNVDLTPSLKDSGRSSSITSLSLLNRALIVTQVALSLLLLIGASLFMRTLVNLQHINPGFNTKNLLLFKVAPGLVGYKDESLIQLYARISERLETLPGVLRVTFSHTRLLADNDSDRSIYLRSAFSAVPDADSRIKATGDSYILYGRENLLGVLEIPLLAGRTFSRLDNEQAPKVVVVNQTFANQFFPNENPIGKRFTMDPKKPDEIEIVGLVKDAKYARHREDAPPTIYLPWRQTTNIMPEANFEVRTTGDPKAITPAVRQAVSEVDKTIPIRSIKTQLEQADETLRIERLFAKLVTLFGLLAQQLAFIGLLCVLAYAVSQRTCEIGTRIALGASQTDVLKMIFRQGMTLTILGVVLGLGGAYVLTRYLEGWMQLSKKLYGIKPIDPMTYVVMTVLVTVVALIACYFPARRAMKVDPMVVLRFE